MTILSCITTSSSSPRSSDGCFRTPLPSPVNRRTHSKTNTVISPLPSTRSFEQQHCERSMQEMNQSTDENLFSEAYRNVRRRFDNESLTPKSVDSPEAADLKPMVPPDQPQTPAINSLPSPTSISGTGACTSSADCRSLVYSVGASISTGNTSSTFPPVDCCDFKQESHKICSSPSFDRCVKPNQIMNITGVAAQAQFPVDDTIGALGTSAPLLPPEAVSTRQIRLLEGHRDYIQAVIFHKDQYLITGSADCSIRVWCTKTWTSIRVLVGHSDTVEVLIIFNDYLISGSCDSSIKVWKLHTWECMNTLTDHTDGVYALTQWNGDLVSGSWDCSIRIWDPLSFNCKQVLSGHSQTIYTMTVWEDKLISGSYDGLIKVWVGECWQCEKTLVGHSGGVYSLAVLENVLVSGSADCTIKVWSTSSWECLHTLLSHSDTVYGLRFYEDFLISVSSDCAINFWSVASWCCAATLNRSSCSMFTLAVNPENGLLVTCGDDERNVDVLKVITH